MTETSSGCNMVQARCVRIGWEAPMMAGSKTEVMLDPEDNEILVRGDSVITEYYKNPEDTAASFTPDGWFKTGDIGEIDHGFLRLVDRKKAIIVLDTGKNVAPARIESRFINSPHIEQLVIFGDNQRYISALIVPAYDYILSVLQAKGISYDTSKLVHAVVNGITTCIEVGPDVAEHPLVYELIKADVDKVNSELADYEGIKKFAIINRKFTEDRGELTPTLKIKMRVVTETFADTIEQLYA